MCIPMAERLEYAAALGGSRCCIGHPDIQDLSGHSQEERKRFTEPPPRYVKIHVGELDPQSHDPLDLHVIVTLKKVGYMAVEIG